MRQDGGTGEVIEIDIRGRLERMFRESERMLEEMKGHEEWRARVAANGEMRKLIAVATRAIQAETRRLEAETRAGAVREFRDGVLEALEQESAEVKRRVLGMFEKRGLMVDC